MLRPKTSCFGGGGDAFRVDIKRFEGHFPFLSDVMRHHEVLQDNGSELPPGDDRPVPRQWCLCSSHRDSVVTNVNNDEDRLVRKYYSRATKSYIFSGVLLLAVA